jgi:two-component system, chemotaxis family, sensor kinase Cph1
MPPEQPPVARATPASDVRADEAAAPRAQGVLSIPAGGHLCLFYNDDPREQLAAMLPFVSQGLANGERCIYVADDLTVFQLHRALASFGIDVLSEMARGALLLLTKSDWRQPGELDSQAKARQVRGMIDEALAAGFSGVRFGVEMTWTLDPSIDAARLRHWEATINTVFTHELPARIICQYSRWRLTPGALHAGLVTHPQAILGEGLYENPYYDAPRILAGEPSSHTPSISAAQFDRMINKIALAGA